MKSRRNHNVSNRIIQIILIGVILVSAFKLGETWISGMKAKQFYDELQEQVRLEAIAVEEQDIEAEVEAYQQAMQPKYPPLELNLSALKAMNNDFRGWLYYPVLGVNYPVVQAADNEYYLRRSFEGEYLRAGCLYMDCEASPDFSDRNSFIFGHNMRDGSMFGRFKELVDDSSICDENPYFYIYTEDKVYTYEIFAYYEVKEDSERYMTFTKDATYDYYVDWALKNSLYQKEMDFSERNNIMTLSTCYGNSGSGKRFLLHGLLIRTEDFKN